MHMILVNLPSAAVGVFERPDAHDVVDLLSAAVEVESPHAHYLVDPLSAVGVVSPLTTALRLRAEGATAP